MSRAESRIPAFKTIEEEAEFWDTHDSSEFDDEFETVTDVKFVRSKRKQPITVRLDQDTVAVLRRQAHRRGIGASTLARMWITERVRDLEERSAVPKAS